MNSHLSLPWTWEDCLSPETCNKVAHVAMDEKSANNTPREWIETLLINCVVSERSIKWVDHKKRIHRVGGPALELEYGRVEWRHEGLLHREDGPAVITTDGDMQWWLDGERQFNHFKGPRIYPQT